jgi:hypothetical protein
MSGYEKKELVDMVKARIGENIVHTKALEFVASKVSESSGDARKMLELVASAVDKCLEGLSPDRRSAAWLHEPIVTVKHMIAANRDTIPKIVETIQYLPQMAQVVLCVAVAVNEAGSFGGTIKLGLVKKYCAEASWKFFDFHETVSDDSFKTLVQQLFDADLMLSGTTDASPFNPSTCSMTRLQEQPVALGVSLQDLESAVEKTLFDQEFYRSLREEVRKVTKLSEP